MKILRIVRLNHIMELRMNLMLILLMFLVFMLPGCAQYHWAKAGATVLDMEKDKNECEFQAAQMYPIQLVTTETIMVQPTRNCRSVSPGAALICNDDPVLKWSNVTDENGSKRNEFVRQCLQARGYQWNKVAP